jgi:predicted MPP superfamily phosphohydrolase
MLTLGAGTGLYAWRIEPHWIEFVARTLPIAGLPGEWAGKRLVQMSDIHVGPHVDDDYVRHVFARVAALAPDLVAITGDLVTYHPGMFEQIRQVYDHCPRGRIATVGCMGNHDYGPHWSDRATSELLRAEYERFGVQILRNDVAEIRGLMIVGLDDLWGPHFAPKPALARVQSPGPAFVLLHNPDMADRPVWGDYEGWILAGHTHGGQCKPPFLPPPILPVENRRYAAGEVAVTDRRRMYINRGVGHSLPVRFNVRPEVTVYTLTPASPT